MKFIFPILLLTSFAAQAVSPVITVKERLRLSLWYEGLEERPLIQKKAPQKPLPEELERAIRKN